MAIRVIRKNEDPVLREVSKHVKNINDNVRKLVDDMLETMRDADGVGLAAPQVGILKRVIVIDIGEGVIELINPEIVETTGNKKGPEGCLSFPGLTGDVCRAEYIKVKGLNRHGEDFCVEGRGILARALQHEIDHLNGVVFLDHADKVFETKK